MQNPMIPQNEVDKLKEVITKTNELFEVHHENTKHFIESSVHGESHSTIVRVHTLMYLKGLKDLLDASKMLESIMERTEEEITADLTSHGESLEAFERMLRTSMLLEMALN